MDGLTLFAGSIDTVKVRRAEWLPVWDLWIESVKVQFGESAPAGFGVLAEALAVFLALALFFDRLMLGNRDGSEKSKKSSRGRLLCASRRGPDAHPGLLFPT